MICCWDKLVSFSFFFNLKKQGMMDGWMDTYKIQGFFPVKKQKKRSFSSKIQKVDSQFTSLNMRALILSIEISDMGSIGRSSPSGEHEEASLVNSSAHHE